MIPTMMKPIITQHARLFVGFAFLLHELESSRTFDGSAENLAQLTLLRQALPDETRDQDLRPFLPLIHHLLWRHHLQDSKQLINRKVKHEVELYLVAVETIQQRDTNDGSFDARMVRERCEDCRFGGNQKV